MVHVVLQGMWILYRINKDEGDEPLPLLGFRRDVVSVICYNDTKHYRVQSEHRPIQIPFKHLRWSVFV